jgi:hypothetical protein
MARKFQGIWIPSELWLTTKLTMQEKLFLVEINSLDNEEGCFATNQYFSNFFNISKTRVTTVLNNLIEKGFINRKIQYEKGTKQISKRVLNICSPPYPTKVVYPPQEMLYTPTQQKLLDSNTRTNNTLNRVPYADILKTWNDTEELCEIRIYQDKRKKKIKKVYDIDNGKTFKEIVTRAINSDFMVAKRLTNIDWMMNEDNYAKILEGKYDNKE